MSGHWRCPACGGLDSEHTIGCEVTDDSDLEWVEDDPAE